MTKLTMTAAEWKKEMLGCFLALGGKLQGEHRDVKGNFRFLPAIDGHGNHYVSVFKGRGSSRHVVLPIDEWAEWASTYVQQVIL